MKRLLAVLIVGCIALSGCNSVPANNKEAGSADSSSISDISASPSAEMPVGRFEGSGAFTSMAGRSEKCEYVLDFFEDGKATISSTSHYFYGVELKDLTFKDGELEFSIHYFNPSMDPAYIPINLRDKYKITFSLTVGEDELKGSTKEGKFKIGITFKRISDTPREYKETDELTLEQMQEDAAVVFEVLETKHPNIFYKQSEADYNKRKEAFLEKLPTLDKKSFVIEFQKLVASIGDAHTSLRMNQISLLFPIYVEYFSGKWHIAGVAKEYKEFLGKEVTAVGETPMDEVFDKVMEFVPVENVSRARVAFGLQIVDLLQWAGIIKDDKATITVNGGEQFTLQAIVPPENPTSDNWMIGQEKFPETYLEKDGAQYPSYYYTHKIIDGMLYIQYNQCVEDDNYPMSKFAEDIAAELAKADYKKIIIDLRYNGGGNSDLLLPIISQVMQAKKKGASIYCFTGGRTFSAAFDNTIELKKRGAILVGQPTGGNMQQFTEIETFELPNSRTGGQYSQKFVNYDENAPYDSLYPDVLIDHTVEAYFNGIDEELEYVRKQK